MNMVDAPRNCVNKCVHITLGQPDSFTAALLLYLDGAGTIDSESVTGITAGYSCSTQAADMDHALP